VPRLRTAKPLVGAPGAVALHKFVTVCTDCKLRRPLATYVNVGCGQRSTFPAYSEAIPLELPRCQRSKNRLSAALG
jgi:hypothetical protein